MGGDCHGLLQSKVSVLICRLVASQSASPPLPSKSILTPLCRGVADSQNSLLQGSAPAKSIWRGQVVRFWPDSDDRTREAVDHLLGNPAEHFLSTSATS